MLIAGILLASAPVVPAGGAFACTPVLVWDGDGPIWCSSGIKVRLAGIAARELDGSCRPGHPCPDATGIAARDFLVLLLGKNAGETPTGHIAVTSHITLQCTSAGSAGGDRTGAWCHSPQVGDLSCAMLRSGLAMRWDRYWNRSPCS